MSGFDRHLFDGDATYADADSLGEVERYLGVLSGAGLA
jgi:hypothetical protein